MIRKHIPNFITSMNLLCGVVGVVFALKGRVDYAFYLMLAASVFDFCDGLAARLLGAYSDMGKELDSLADLVSFGVLPSVMLYNTSKVCMFGESFVCWIPLVIAVFSGLRLAKFNVDERQTSNFLGLPTPSCALLCSSLCYYVACDPACLLAEWCAGPVFIPVLSVVLSLLLVSEVPMFSMKFHKGDSKTLMVKRISFIALVAVVALACLVFKLNWSLAVTAAFVIYIAKNLVYAVFKI